MEIAMRPPELPEFTGALPDTHAHLVMLDDPAGALERAAMAHVSYIVTIADATEAPEGTFENLPKWTAEARRRLRDWSVDAIEPEVRIVLGTHPHNAKDYSERVEALTADLAGDHRVAAIGEIGLDYHYDHSPRGDQRRAFRSQIALAKRLGLPIVVHLREAHDEGHAILEDVGLPERGCVLHCFTAKPDVLQPFIDLGCYISFAGPTTFPKAVGIREAAALVPEDRLLVETDCPFLAPVPFRGRSNEPAWVTLTAATVADVRGVPLEGLAAAVSGNARRVFGPRA